MTYINIHLVAYNISANTPNTQLNMAGMRASGLEDFK